MCPSAPISYLLPSFQGIGALSFLIHDNAFCFQTIQRIYSWNGKSAKWLILSNEMERKIKGTWCG